MAKAPTQFEQKKRMKAAQAQAEVAAGRRPHLPPSPGGGRKRIPMPFNPKRPMPKPGMGAPGSAIAGTRPGGKGGAGPAAQSAAARQAAGSKGGPRPMGPGQVAKMAKLADMAGMQRMKGGGYLKKNIDGKASKGKTKGRNC